MTQYQLVVLVVDDPDNCPDILEAWEAAGVSGVTIVESSGLGRFKRAGMRDDIPLLPSLADLFQSEEVRHRTLFSVVDSQEKVDQMAAAAQNVIGDLEAGDTGFMFVVPVSRIYGMGRAQDAGNLEAASE
jgi:nitrogen regulatory protein PII